MTSSNVVNFVDIHTHILPGIDDGAKNTDESLRIINEAVDSGVKAIMLSPHFPFNNLGLDRITREFESLRRIVSENSIDISLHLGAELALSPDIPQLIKGDKRLTVNGKGKYALIELPFSGIPMYASSIFFQLLTMGVTPIWAHPERCVDVFNDYTVVSSYVNNGVLMQINAGSLLGKYGRDVRSCAVSMVKKGFCHILASDIHRSGDIGMLLRDAFSSLEKTVGYERALDIVFSNPSKVIS